MLIPVLKLQLVKKICVFVYFCTLKISGIFKYKFKLN